MRPTLLAMVCILSLGATASAQQSIVQVPPTKWDNRSGCFTKNIRIPVSIIVASGISIR